MIPMANTTQTRHQNTSNRENDCIISRIQEAAAIMGGNAEWFETGKKNKENFYYKFLLKAIPELCNDDSGNGLGTKKERLAFDKYMCSLCYNVPSSELTLLDILNWLLDRDLLFAEERWNSNQFTFEILGEEKYNQQLEAWNQQQLCREDIVFMVGEPRNTLKRECLAMRERSVIN